MSAALYAAFTAGQPSALPELSVQYADYAAWQREWLSGGETERQLAFWKEHLGGARTQLSGEGVSGELTPGLIVASYSRQARSQTE